MRKLIAPLIIAATISMPAFAQQASKESVKELLKITKSEQLIDQSNEYIYKFTASSIEQATQGQAISAKQKKAIENYSQNIANIVKRDFTWEKLEPEMIKIYVEEFTQAEINGMLEFYKTPVGQSTIDKMPIVMQKSMQLGYTQMNELTPKIMQETEKLAKELKAKE
ncbi:DUF2059 domain-containing protein [Acinetobacter sp. NIPH 2699]|uniref:DUF2059 domain-containing protein n=1 Tax=Acinetobacter sp. NIPH 2699 TaxID=2923433 RepID=UPI001F4B1D7E|nr:DUF2059 domain-containing protein [Acinetobacter sp. NIPH 2699]MCH7335956.1 DUF2059 domain-containing protein [Acinetobacter sp. NIPH 2699]